MGQIEHDNYPTPEPLAREIIKQEADHGVVPSVFIEPSCGGGAFIKAAREFWPTCRIIGVDIVGRYRQHALDAGANEFIQADWVNVAEDIMETEQEYGRVLVGGNPPFSFAQLHIEKALAHMAPGNLLSFLLRNSFFGSVHRANTFWVPQRQNFFAYTPITPRPSYVVFTRDPETGKRKKKTTTDNSEYGVYHFLKYGPGRDAFPPRIHPPLVWRR